jgi:hypothetical protein
MMPPCAGIGVSTIVKVPRCMAKAQVHVVKVLVM